MPNYQVVVETSLLPPQVQGLVNEYKSAIGQIADAAKAGTTTAPAASIGLRTATVTAQSSLRGVAAANPGLLSKSELDAITRSINLQYRTAASDIGTALGSEVKAFSSSTISSDVRKQIGANPATPVYQRNAPNPASAGELDPSGSTLSLYTDRRRQQEAMVRAAASDEEYVAANSGLLVAKKELRTATADASRAEIEAANLARRQADSGNAGPFQNLRNSFRPPTSGTLPSDEQSGADFFGQRVLTTATYGAAATALYSIVNQAKQAVQETLALQDAMATLNAQANALGESSGVAQFRSDLLGIARDTGTSAVDVVNLGIQMRGAFGSTEAAIEATNEAIRAAQVTGLPLVQVVNDLEAASVSYGVSIDTITDKSVGLQQRFGILSSEALTTFGSVANSAKDAGLNIDQIGGIVGVLTQRLQLSGTAIGGALDRIFPAVQTKASDILLQADQSPLQSQVPQLQKELASGDTGQVLLTIASSWDKLTKAQQNNLITTIASRRDQPVLQALFAGNKQILDEVANANQDAGKAAEVQAQKQQTLSYQLKRTREDLAQIVDALGRIGILQGLTLFLATIQGGLGVIGSFVRLLADMNNSLDGIPGKMLSVALAIVAVEKAVAAVGAIGGIASSAGAGGGILGRLLGGLGGKGAAGAAADGEKVAGGGGLLTGVGEAFGGGALVGGLVVGGVGAAALFAAEHEYSESEKDKAQQRATQGKLADKSFEDIEKIYADAYRSGGSLAIHSIGGTGALTNAANKQFQAAIDSGVFGNAGSPDEKNAQNILKQAQSGGIQGPGAQAEVIKLLNDASKSTNQKVKDAATKAKDVASAVADGGASTVASAQDLAEQYQAGDISFTSYIAALNRQIEVLKGGDQTTQKQATTILQQRNQAVDQQVSQSATLSATLQQLGGTDAGQAKIQSLYAALANPQFTDPGARTDTLVQLLQAEQDDLKTRIQNATSYEQAAAIAKQGVTVTPAQIKELTARLIAGGTDPATASAIVASIIQLDAQTQANMLNEIQVAQAVAQLKANRPEFQTAAQAALSDLQEAQTTGSIHAQNPFETDTQKANDTAAATQAAAAASQAQRQEAVDRTNALFDIRTAQAHGNQAVIDQINIERAQAQAANLDPTNGNAAIEAAAQVAQANAQSQDDARQRAGEVASARLDIAVAAAGQNQLLVAQLAKQRAAEEAAYAPIGDYAAQLRAQAASIQADYQLQTYLDDAAKAKNELAQAIAASLGDVAQVAQLTVDQANAELERAKVNNFLGAGDQAEVDRAQAAAVKAKTDQTNQARQAREDDLAYLYQWDKITAQQYIASLTLELQKIPESNVDARREIENKINQVRKDLSSNLQFNIGDIKLPTYYDAKRLEAGGGVYGVASAGTTTDNRVFNIQLNANSSTEVTAGFQQILQALQAPPVTGNRPRTYP